MAKNEASGLAESDERQVARPVAPPEKRHSHQFDALYDPRIDRWFCRCGVSMDRYAGLWNADGSRRQMTVNCTTGEDLGVRSGRERLTC